MNGAHWHLVLNHLPIIIPIVGLFMMVGGFLLKSEILKRAAYCIFIVGALTAVAAFSTGEGAEEVVEEINGIDERLIHVHEEAAEIFASLLYILGGVSLIGLWANWKEKSFSTIISIAIIGFALVVLFYAKQTGTTGGEIRHTEIRANSSNNNSNVNQNTEHDEDD
ncbi:MAG: putative membrane protein [Cyclobacteriaceae bacterium]|jgi:uncharacterized membrane protein